MEDVEQKKGYLLTKTPLIAKRELYKISGHWDHYLDGMFVLGDPDDEWDHWFAQHALPPVPRYVATFNDSEAQNRAARDGVGVALGRLTRARLLLDSGQLVALTQRPVKASYAHYLVSPARTAGHAGFEHFRAWLLQQAREHDASNAAPLG